MAQLANPKLRLKQRTRVDQQGRVVIPAEIRQELGFEPGEPVTFIVKDGVLQVMTIKQAVSRVQEKVRERLGDTTGLVDEFLAERRREAERE
jgi:AbrB family looped-hinge helix DNA binding protein